MKRIQNLLIILLGLILAGLAWILPFSGVIDNLVYDRLLQSTTISPQKSEVLVVGIDDESLNRYSQPLVMWHEQLAGVISAAGASGARSIGLDLIPTVSMERLAPGLDISLMQAIRSTTRQGTSVFLGFSAGRHGTMPEKKFSLVASGLGYLNLFPDQDGTVRRQIVSLQDQQGRAALSLAWLLADKPAELDPKIYNSTYIDYRQPAVQTVSLAHVLQLVEEQDTASLRALFADKTVLVGVTTPRLQDMHRLPTALDLGEYGFLPGVQIHAMMIQSLRHGRLRQDALKSVDVFLLLLAGAIASSLFLHQPPRKAVLTLAGLVLATTLVSYWSFSAGCVLSASAAAYGILVPAMTALVFRLTHQYQFTDTLSRFFRTYVNLDRMEEIMANPWARLQQEKQLKQAIARREQYLCYQPKVDASNGCMVGMEALVRWRKPNGEFVSPGHFVPLAEETGLVTKLTELVVDRACQFARVLADRVPEGQKPLPKISVNLSARDLERLDLVDSILTATNRHGIRPAQIDLEITESSLIHQMKVAIGKISDLREAGFSISIDDFGTGQSSLGYITQIPFDNLKIDKSLIDHIAIEQRAHAVVSAIITMARGLGSHVVAEGVEDTEQLENLKNLGCDQIQGYVFSRPLEENQILEIIVSGKTFSGGKG